MPLARSGFSTPLRPRSQLKFVYVYAVYQRAIVALSKEAKSASGESLSCRLYMTEHIAQNEGQQGRIDAERAGCRQCAVARSYLF